jgi:hypothetical protein
MSYPGCRAERNATSTFELLRSMLGLENLEQRLAKLEIKA